MNLSLENIYCCCLKVITRRWLRADAPTEQSWFEIIKEIHELEQMIFLQRLRKDFYMKGGKIDPLAYNMWTEKVLEFCHMEHITYTLRL